MGHQGRLAAACFVALVIFAPLAGCSSSSNSASANAADGGPSSGDAAAAGDAGGTSTVTFEMDLPVPAGGEMFECQYVTLPSTLPAKGAYMIAGSSHYTPGSHHLNMYTTDQTAIPAGGGQVHDCSNSMDSMSHTNGIMYTAQTPTETLAWPPTVGFPVHGGQVLLFNVHYLNPTASPLNAQVTVNFTITTDTSKITQTGGVLFFEDELIYVPAGSKASAQARCPIPKDITMVLGASHYHMRGVNYGAYIDSPPALGATPFYTSTNWDDPGFFKGPIPVKAGSAIRWQCNYDNTSGAQAFVYGDSALSNEMCMFVALYYPDMGQAVDNCDVGEDMYGAGTATCGQTWSCLDTCMESLFPAGDAGVDSGGAFLGGADDGGLGTSNYAPCVQQCFVESCPTASGAVLPLLDCLFADPTCAPICGCNSTGTACSALASDACTSCVQTSCSAQWTTCQQHTCN